jgi:rapamycin-insensitive companion of mTOR
LNICRTFTRDAKHLTEKTQCLKLVRSLLSLSTVISPASSSSSGRGRIPLSDAIVRTLVSVAENADDAFKGICLETLAEIGECRLLSLYTSDWIRGR